MESVTFDEKKGEIEQATPTTTATTTKIVTTLETTLHAVNPSSVKCQCRKGGANEAAGMLTIAGDVAKPFLALPLGTKITFVIKSE